jgi:hypothetical protein
LEDRQASSSSPSSLLSVALKEVWLPQAVHRQ